MISGRVGNVNKERKDGHRKRRRGRGKTAEEKDGGAVRKRKERVQIKKDKLIRNIV